MIGDATSDVNTTSMSCESAIVAPWGSLYPVTSRSTGFIYKNELCAHAHSVTDLVYWKAVVSCRENRFESILRFLGYLGDGLPNMCYVFFEFDNADIDITANLCYTNKNDKCSFDVKDQTRFEFSPEEIRLGCESGLLSSMPATMFVNALCYLCEKENVAVDLEGYCDKRGQKLPDTSISFLIDPSSAQQNVFVKSDITTEACITHQTNTNVSILLRFTSYIYIPRISLIIQIHELIYTVKNLFNDLKLLKDIISVDVM